MGGVYREHIQEYFDACWGRRRRNDWPDRFCSGRRTGPVLLAAAKTSGCHRRNPALGKQVAEATDGRVTVRVLPNRWDHRQHIMTWPQMASQTLLTACIPSRVMIVSCGRASDNSLHCRHGNRGSKAYWNVYADTMDAQAEHKGTKLLGLWIHGPAMFHNNQRQISAVEDFSGLKIRTPGGYIADLSKDLGITTQFMGPGEVYEKLSRRCD